MPGDLVTMNPTELERLALMRALAEHRTTQRLVAEQLGLTVRQVERLYARFKADAPRGWSRASEVPPATGRWRRSCASWPSSWSGTH